MWLKARPAANTAAVVTVDGTRNQLNRVDLLRRIDWSYIGGSPTGGSLTVQVNGEEIWSVDIAAQGPGSISLDENEAIKGVRGKDIVVTLSAAGETVTGKLNVKVDD